MSESQARRCIIDDEGTEVTIRLLVHNALRAGSDFWLRSADGEELEEWTMEAGVSGSSDHVIAVDASDLDRAELRWKILVCTAKDTIRSGRIEVQVLQDGVPRPMTKPAQWELTGIPGCETKQARVIRTGLRFLGDPA